MLDFIDQLQALATKIQRQRDQIETEEATKTAFVMPFISLLGYDVFDPSEVVPEYTADVGIKKGEKVDYAILHDGEPAILFECKKCDASLDDIHISQLFRYFSATEARIGVLTNGVVYRFFSDLEKTNQMDSTPFLEFNLLDMQESLLAELKKLTKSGFNLGEVLSTASDLKYTREIKLFLDEQVTEPRFCSVSGFTGLPWIKNPECPRSVRSDHKACLCPVHQRPHQQASEVGVERR